MIVAWYGNWQATGSESYDAFVEPIEPEVAPVPAYDFKGGPGLVVGRFDPPHRGHAHLVNFAANLCPNLRIAIAEEPASIPAAQRQAWLEEMFPFANTGVFRSEPGEVVQGPIECLFTSDDSQGARDLASRLGARLVVVDPQRLSVPVRARDIRRKPLANWRYIPDAVRAHYAVRVALVGAESAGKTSLAQKLSDHYSTVWVQEQALLLANNRYGKLIAADFAGLAKAQRSAENALARQANRLLVCDTDLYNLAAWSRRLFRVCDFEADLAPSRYDLHLLLEPRESTDTTVQFNAVLRQGLHSHKRRVCELKGDLEAQMLPKAIEAIETVLLEPRLPV